MNTAFVNIIKQIVNRQGEAILGDPARLKQFVHKEARAVPAELRLSFGRCIEQGYYRVLKQASSAEERSRIKPQIARQMHHITKLDETLCAEAVDVLEAALYAKLPPANRLPRISQRVKKAIIALSAAVLAAAVIVMAALNWSVAAFEPIVEFNGEAYPSKIIATAAVTSMLGGSPRMIETEDYIGDALGDFGVKFRSALPEGIVRVEIEGDYFITKSTLEAYIQTKKSVELFPRINYNYGELENLREPHSENVTFRLYVNDKLKKQKTLAIPFHRLEDEPVWDASRNGNKTLNNYHFVVVIRQAERIERELERIQQEAEAEAARQREEMRRETEAEAARRREAERRAAEAERRASEAARARPSPAPITDPYNDKRIWDTLAKVHDNLYDVNGDGRTNCVDYSNLFYYYSPFKYNDVVVNYNKKTGFNHQFNAVTIDGKIVYIEPQARSPRSYDLRKFWGSEYNPNYNQMGNTNWLFLPRGKSGTEE
jgi:hypothetical protein